MMLAKIISGGQTGADRAALDFAIKFDIPHGGWIPKGRRTEDGPLPDQYQLREMPTASYPKRTEKNIIDSDGTLILSHGNLTGGSALTLKIAKGYGLEWLHVDFLKTGIFDAAHLINSWIVRHGIRILNVAGARASEDPKIYDATFKVLEVAFHLALVETSLNRPARDVRLPRTVNEAVNRLISELSLKEKAQLARMDGEALSSLFFTLGQYIIEQFGLMGGNDELMESCRSYSDDNDINTEVASEIILNALWERLRQTYRLRLVGSTNGGHGR